MTAKIHWKLEFSRRILQTNIATYVEMTMNKSQSVRSQLFIKDRPFLPDDILNLIHLNNCMERVNMKQDINPSTESFANAISEAVNAFTVQKLSNPLDAVRP